jgi:hypothetical protein
MREPLPLAMVQGAVLEFLRGRDDGVVFEAPAVNVSVSEPGRVTASPPPSPRPGAAGG